jgi:hypothetical protein
LALADRAHQLVAHQMRPLGAILFLEVLPLVLVVLSTVMLPLELLDKDMQQEQVVQTVVVVAVEQHSVD